MDDTTRDGNEVVDETGEDEHAMEEAADLEARLATLAGRVVELESELATAKETLIARDAHSALDAAIAKAGAVDPETVRLLIERAAANEPDAGVEELIAALKDRKPLLFRSMRIDGSPMAVKPTRRSDNTLATARDAAANGDRASLLRYLRVRREHA